MGGKGYLRSNTEENFTFEYFSIRLTKMHFIGDPINANIFTIGIPNLKGWGRGGVDGGGNIDGWGDQSKWGKD